MTATEVVEIIKDGKERVSELDASRIGQWATEFLADVKDAPEYDDVTVSVGIRPDGDFDLMIGLYKEGVRIGNAVAVTYSYTRTMAQVTQRKVQVH